MALADLMKKGFLTSQKPATPAAVATHCAENRPSVANAATVAALPDFTSITKKGSLFQHGLIREFMEVDGLTFAKAQELAALSMQPRPACEWLILISELDALVEHYCAVAGLTDEVKGKFLTARRCQSLASIPESIDWFKCEMERMGDVGA